MAKPNEYNSKYAKFNFKLQGIFQSKYLSLHKDFSTAENLSIGQIKF